MAASPPLAQPSVDTVPGEFIVRLAPGTPTAALEDLGSNANLSLQPVRPLSRRLGIWLVRYDATRIDASAALAALQATPEVALAQHNHRVALRTSAPDDERFGQMWNLDNTGQTGGTLDADVDAPEAWDLVRGGTSAHGDEIVIAIVDDGFDLGHPDLDFWKNEGETPNNGADDDANGYIDDYDGWSAYTSSGTITVLTHGHHVAGTAAARGNNEIGVAGVNWGARIMPIQGASGNEATVLGAYGYAHELRATYNETDGAAGAFVVATNASFGVDFGDPADFPIWCSFYDDLAAVGILSAGATANLNIDIDSTGDVPTACASDYMIAVTNTTHNDTKNGGAAYGTTTIDLGAPGTSILSTFPGNGYGMLTGTSMATPHVAGAAALLVAGFSGARLQEYKDDPEAVLLDVRDALLDGTDPLPTLDGVTVSGGRLNLYNSLLEAFGDDPNTIVFDEDETIEDETFEGENLYVLAGSRLTLEGEITLQADAQGTPSFLYVVGDLDDEEATVTLLDGSQIIYRDGSVPILPTLPPGPGAALAFDGEARVTVEEADGLPTAEAFTVSMWMQADALDGEPVLVQQGAGDALLYRLDLVEGDEGWHFRYTHTGEDGTVEHVFEDLAVKAEQPYHVALTRDLAPAAVRLYVGGQRIGGTFVLASLPDDVDDPVFSIGGAADGDGIEGVVDEVRVYDINLFADVAETMHETLEGDQLEGLLAYFRMEGEDEDLVFDFSPAANHAAALGTETAASPFPLGQASALLDANRAEGSVGEVGASLDATVAAASDDASLSLYAYDAALDAVVGSDEETLPDGVIARSALVWGAYERGEVTADLLVNYSLLPVESVPVGDRLLLYRIAPGTRWTDVTAAWTHDTDARRFVIGEAEIFGEFTIGFGAPSTSGEDDAARSTAYTLSSTYPNPFRRAAAFTLRVAEAQRVAVEVFDVLGRRVARLHDGPLAADEPYLFTLHGRTLPSGLYVVRATGETFTAVQTVTRVR